MATNDSVNMNSVKMGVGPICVTTARNGQDGHASIDQSAREAVPSSATTTTVTDVLSPTRAHSTDSLGSIPASGESLPLFRSEGSEARGRNQVSSTAKDDVEQQRARTLAHENMAMDVTASIADTYSSTFSPAPGTSTVAEAKSTTEERVVRVHPYTNIGTDKQGEQSSSTSPGTARDTLAAGVNTQQGDIEMMIHSSPLTTNTISPIPVAFPTISNPSLRTSEGQNSRLIAIITGRDVELGMPALTHANMIHVAPSTTDSHNLTLSTEPGAPLLAEVEGTSKELGGITTDNGVEIDSHDNQSSSTEQTERTSLETTFDTVAAGVDSRYSKEHTMSNVER